MCISKKNRFITSITSKRRLKMALTESRLVTTLAVIMHNQARGTIAPTFAAVVNKLSARYGEAAVKNREGVLRECYDHFNTEAIQYKRTVIVEGTELEEVFEDALEAPAQSTAPVKKERKGPTIYLLSPEMAAFCGKLNASKAEVERTIVEHANEKGLYLDSANDKRMRLDTTLSVLLSLEHHQMVSPPELRAAAFKHCRSLNDLDGSKKRKRDEAVAARKASSGKDGDEKVGAKPAKKAKAAKAPGEPRASNPNSALNQLQLLSEPLQKLLGESKLSRSAALKAIWVHIKKKNLQCDMNKRVILFDAEMLAVFSKHAYDVHKEVLDTEDGDDKSKSKKREINRIISEIPGQDISTFCHMLELTTLLNFHLTKCDEPATLSMDKSAEVHEQADDAIVIKDESDAAYHPFVKTEAQIKTEPSTELSVSVKAESSHHSATPKINYSAVKMEPWNNYQGNFSQKSDPGTQQDSDGDEGAGLRDTDEDEPRNEDGDLLVHGNGGDSDGEWYS